MKLSEGIMKKREKEHITPLGKPVVHLDMVTSEWQDHFYFAYFCPFQIPTMIC